MVVLTVRPATCFHGQILRRNKRKRSPVRRVTFFFPPIISLRGRCYYTEMAQEEAKLTIERNGSPVCPAPLYTSRPRSARVACKPSLKKIHFLDNDRTSMLQPGLRNGEPDADEKEDSRGKQATTIARIYEFNRPCRRSANFAKQKPASKATTCEIRWTVTS